MTKFQIPRIFLGGFESISKLTLQQSTEISTLLEEIQVGANEQVLGKLLHDKISLSEWESFNVSSVLFSLITLEISVGESGDPFIQGVAQAFVDQTQNKTEDGEKLAANLSVILKSNGRLKLTQKANFLQGEYEKVYREGRIISDIRLVYDEGEGADIKSAKHALVVHQLRITYSDSGKQRTTYFAMDKNDLEKLKETIIRAQAKDKQIKDNTYSSSLEYFDFGT